MSGGFAVTTACAVHGHVDTTCMPSTDVVTQAAAVRAAVMMWEALHGCPGQVTAVLQPYSGGLTEWTYSAEAPFLKGTIPGTRGEQFRGL